VTTLLTDSASSFISYPDKRPVSGRNNIIELGEITVIDDCYWIKRNGGFDFSKLLRKSKNDKQQF